MSSTSIDAFPYPGTFSDPTGGSGRFFPYLRTRSSPPSSFSSSQQVRFSRSTLPAHPFTGAVHWLLPSCALPSEERLTVQPSRSLYLEAGKILTNERRPPGFPKGHRRSICPTGLSRAIRGRTFDRAAMSVPPPHFLPPPPRLGLVHSPKEFPWIRVFSTSSWLGLGMPLGVLEVRSRRRCLKDLRFSMSTVDCNNQ